MNLILKATHLKQDLRARILTFTGYTVRVLKVIILRHKHKDMCLIIF